MQSIFSPSCLRRMSAQRWVSGSCILPFSVLFTLICWCFADCASGRSECLNPEARSRSCTATAGQDDQGSRVQSTSYSGPCPDKYILALDSHKGVVGAGQKDAVKQAHPQPVPLERNVPAHPSWNFRSLPQPPGPNLTSEYCVCLRVKVPSAISVVRHLVIFVSKWFVILNQPKWHRPWKVLRLFEI